MKKTYRPLPSAAIASYCAATHKRKDSTAVTEIHSPEIADNRGSKESDCLSVDFVSVTMFKLLITIDFWDPTQLFQHFLTLFTILFSYYPVLISYYCDFCYSDYSDYEPLIAFSLVSVTCPPTPPRVLVDPSLPLPPSHQKKSA